MMTGRLRLSTVLFVSAIASASALSCSPPGARPADVSPDAAVTFTSSALVTNPATWQNLWGSWPLARYDMPLSYDSDRKIMVTFGGRQNTQGPYYDDTWEWDGARGSWLE